ncbi:lysophosphatidylserine lipase ABHD12 isoform X2 [Culicoides brevitarsis]|uniref:lysophosphatidylserine lipase ABHD12 isoform X2 n=1 Tax=Culicoides brevitarsis TaxID=469753 RepID=UPI00307B3F86
MVYCAVTKRKIKRITSLGLKIGLLISIIFFIVFPLIFKYSYKLQRAVLFLTFIRYPGNLDLGRPDRSGLYATRNFYIYHRDPKREKDVRIGVWHVLPNFVVTRFSKELRVRDNVLANITLNEREDHLSALNEENFNRISEKFGAGFQVEHHGDNGESKKSFYEALLRDTKIPVVLYLHGNTASRGAQHRVDMYQTLRAQGYHVIAFDYRGFGDSSSLGPSARAVVLDAKNVYKYIVEKTENPILIWGHSLGTGIGTHLLTELQQMEIRKPRGIILESPFNNIKDEISEHPFARAYKYLPWFEFTIVNPMFQNQLTFDSDERVAEIKLPIMILHAEDDRVVPFRLGYKLYRTALKTRPKNFAPIEFYRFAASHGYGHRWICRAPELPSIVNGFFDKYEDS